jgi:twitching motility two-component system response regulator PilG
VEVARTLLQEAVDAAPENPAAWFWLAVVSPTAEAAISHLRRVLAIDASHVAARDALAKLLLAQAERMREATRRLFREAAVIAPEDPRIWRAVVQLAETPAEALAAVRDLLKSAPDFAEGRIFLRDALVADARAQASAGDHATAHERWQELKALGGDPGAEAAPPGADVQWVTGEGPAPSASRTVMVVDDSPTIRKILTLTLEAAGYSVICAADGESALQHLSGVVPDAILLDIAMPGIDGYETCKRIKADARTAHLPILMLSGKDALFDKVKGHVAGATEYLTKPFEAETVLAAVASACTDAA